MRQTSAGRWLGQEKCIDDMIGQIFEHDQKLEGNFADGDSIGYRADSVSVSTI
jgi:hypothetical protein